MLETVLSRKYWHVIDIVKFFESMEEFMSDFYYLVNRFHHCDQRTSNYVLNTQASLRRLHLEITPTNSMTPIYK